MTSPNTTPSTTLFTVRVLRFRREHAARAARSSIRMLAAVILAGGGLVATGLLSTAPAAAADASCADGVTVVVDFTDLGGTVDVACAEGPQATGRAALLAAGFAATDSQPGFLCAINSMPDPCPTTFTGSFWSYWHSTPNGEWTSYQVGADSSSPAQGELDGWRYNDGTTPPGITPADAAAATPEPAPTATTFTGTDDPSSDEAFTTSTTPGERVREAQNDAITFTTIGFFVLIVGLVALFVVRSRRQKRAADPSSEPDGTHGTHDTGDPGNPEDQGDTHNAP